MQTLKPDIIEAVMEADLHAFFYLDDLAYVIHVSPSIALAESKFKLLFLACLHETRILCSRRCVRDIIQLVFQKHPKSMGPSRVAHEM